MNLTFDLVVTLTIAILCVSAEIIIAISLAKRWIKYNAKTLTLFLLALMSLFLADGSGLVAMFITDASLLIPVYKFSLIGSMISVCFLLYFFEAFEFDTIFTWKQMVHTLLLGGTMVAILLGEFGTTFHPELDLLTVSLDPLTEFLTFFLPGMGSLLIILSLWKGYNDAWAIQKKQLKYMMIGIVIAYMVPFMLRPVADAFSSMIFSIFLRADVAIGFILYYISFGSRDNFAVFNRHQADRILVIHETGIPLFSYDFKADDESLDETLFAGGIVAITSLMKEATQSTADISEVKLEGNQLILERKNQVLALILTPQTTFYLRGALKRFATAFIREFAESVSSMAYIESQTFSKGGKRLVYESFGVE
ncbi:MAG: hypothetical protein ACW98F_02760 [Candidatus Hodarchaeales archaeon]|jgi:hypothetical protein